MLPLPRQHAAGDQRPDRAAAAKARPSVNGFTLVEVMVTIAIIAILAGIALPSYTDYVRRGQLPEAFNYLSDYRVKMEQYYQDNRGYGTLGGTACANAAGAPSWANFTPASAKHFAFTCALNGSGDNQGFTLTATGNTGKAIGHIYTLNSSNVKSTTQFKGQSVSGKSCWLVNGSEC